MAQAQALMGNADPIPATVSSLSTSPVVAPVLYAQVEFNEDFVSSEAGQKVDFSRYAKGNPLLPGNYRVDVSLNGRVLGRVDVSVMPRPGETEGYVCVTQQLLERLSVDFEKVPERATAALAQKGCLAIEEVVDGATVGLDVAALTLDVSIPQAMLRRTPRGYVSPQLWDGGTTAGLFGYNFNTYHNTSGGHSSNSSYLGLNLGFNVGGWYFRHNGAMSWKPRADNRYETQNTFVQHDLSSISSRLTVGESNTNGQIFDTLPFTGVQLASDDRMLPDSQRGYAPVVRGIARTNARVTIRQSGVIIYDTPVSPGPFEIADLYPTGYGGNLDVFVTEADGRTQTFAIPYASVPQLLRPDSMRYSATLGTLRNPALPNNPGLFQGSLQRGFTNSLTGYAGLQANEGYAAALVGAAFSTPVGAVSADFTQAHTDTGPDRLSGNSVRLGYSKYLEETSSNISIAAYRFSTRNFLDFNSAMLVTNAVKRGVDSDSIWRERNRMSLTFSQSLGDKGGQLSISGFAQNYWNRDQRDAQYQVSYNNRFRSVSYSLSLNRVRNIDGKMENTFMVSLDVPLGKDVQGSLNMSRGNSGETVRQAILGGMAGADKQFSYGGSLTDSSVSGTSGSINGQYRSPFTNLQGTYGQGRGYRGASLGLSGVAVAHSGGITLSPYAGETIALVEAPDAAGAKILGYPGVELDGRGFGVVPYLTPYRLNEVAIDPKGLSTDVELQTTSQQVSPHAGAVVHLPYKTSTGRAVLIDSAQSDGAVLPFGAEVNDEQGRHVGTVGQGGQVFARLIDGAKGLLTVTWGGGEAQQCRIDLSNLAPRDSAGKSRAVERLERVCMSQVGSRHGAIEKTRH